MIRLAFILLITSCTVPRMTAPTVDDLAGCPMYYGYNDPGFYQPANKIDLSKWPQEGETGVRTMPIWSTVDNHIDQCDHVWIHTATPARDSTVTVRYHSEIQTLEYYESKTYTVVAQRPCICLYCHITNKCF